MLKPIINSCIDKLLLPVTGDVDLDIRPISALIYNTSVNKNTVISNYNGSVINSSGVLENTVDNTLRIGYDWFGRFTGAKREASRVNSVLHSIATGGGQWYDTGTTISLNSGIGLNGENNKVKVTIDTSSGSHYVAQVDNSSFTSGVTYTQWCIAESGTVDRLQITFTGGAFGVGQYANFSLKEAGTVLLVAGGSAFIARLGNSNRYLCSFTATATATASGTPFVIGFINSDTAGRLPSFTGTTGDFYILHAQVEVGDYHTSTITTNGSTVTRATDIIKQPLPSTDTLSSKGTILVKTNVEEIQSGSMYLWDSSDGSVGIAIRKKSGTDTIEVFYYKGAVAYFYTVMSNIVTGKINVAVTWSDNGIKAAYNGLAATADTFKGPIDFTGVTEYGIGGKVEDGLEGIQKGDIFDCNVYDFEASEDWLISQTYIDPDIDLIEGTNIDSGITAVNSNGSYTDKYGVFHFPEDDIVRTTYDLDGNFKGMLLEGSTLNREPNSMMEGAVVGIVGAGGSLPTGYTVEASAGLTTTVTGVGTERGLPYVEVNIAGTATGSYQLQGSPTYSNTLGIKYTASLYTKDISGFSDIVSRGVRIQELSGSFPIAITQDSVERTTLDRFQVQRTTTDSTTLAVRFYVNITASTVVDYTFRLYLFQLEASDTATSAIPTYGAAATRTRDNVRRDLSHLDLSKGFTLVVDSTLLDVNGASYPDLIRLSNSASGTNRHVIIWNSAFNFGVTGYANGAQEYATTGLGGVIGDRSKIAFSVGPNYYKAVDSLGHSGSSTSIDYVAPTTLYLSSNESGSAMTDAYHHKVQVLEGIKNQAELEELIS